MAPAPRNRLTPDEYVNGILAGERIILSRAITLIESDHPYDISLGQKVIQQCLPYTGNAYRIGITGVPGVGKSTFIDALGKRLTKDNQKVAVLAVDPTSSISKGSILGDKTRMNKLSHDPLAYIRPSPTSGSLGGVARKTRETLLLFEAAGYPYILIETVGVGQSETIVREMVDFFLLLMLPNAGDELQGIKKGIMEMADLIVINKSDGENQAQARIAKATYSQALRLFAPTNPNWKPAVLNCSAINDIGMDDILTSIHQYKSAMVENGFWEKQRKTQAISWMEDSIQHNLHQLFHRNDQVKRKKKELQEKIEKNEISPIQAANILIKTWKQSNSQD